MDKLMNKPIRFKDLNILTMKFSSFTNSSLQQASVMFLKGKNHLKSLLFLFILLYAPASYAANETIASGAFVVNMGITPQTVGNGLKPYGMIYDLVKNYNVPVRWIINPAKAKDGIDFSHNGIDYKGGPFIIPAEFRTAAVDARIIFWQGQGVMGSTTVSAITVPVFQTMDFVPRWTLDKQNGAIAQKFLIAAGIPSTAYDFLDPQLLSACNDLFVMPHADPAWATHSNLLAWNQTYKGGIWAGCHAVSALELMFNPGSPSQQTNFLSNKTGNALGAGPYASPDNSLIKWTSHSGGSIPYNNAFPAEPVMQFMGITDGAHVNGSEQIYLPVLAGSWRATTKIGVWDPTQANVPANSPGLAALIAFGPAFGDPLRGKILYEAGHDIGGTSAAQVAAQRAFFNWSFWAAKDKAVSIAVSPPPAIMNGGQSYPVSVTVNNPIAPPYTYRWSSSCMGTFGDSTAASTTFTPPMVMGNTACVVTLKVTDACGRVAFYSKQDTIVPGPRVPQAVNDNAFLPSCPGTNDSVVVHVLTNDSDPDSDPLIIKGLLMSNNGTWTFDSIAGTVTYKPATNFTGVATSKYIVCANFPQCDTALITVSVGSVDGNGCLPGQVFTFASSDTTTAQTSVGVTNPANAVGPNDYDAADVNTYAVLGAGDTLKLDFGSLKTMGDTVRVYFASATNGSSVTLSVAYGTNGTTWTPVAGPFSTTSDDPGELASFALPMGGLRYLRLFRSAGTPNLRIDAAEIETFTCTSAIPVATDDAVTTPEDEEVIIDVLSNDYSPVGSALNVTSITVAPTLGAVSINPDNTITYLNTKDVSGIDMFTYQVCDANGYCATAVVTVTITDDGCPVNQYKAITIGSDTTVTITATEGAQLNGGGMMKKDMINAGSADFEIGKDAANELRGVYKFSLASIPMGANITNADFKLYRKDGKDQINLSVHNLKESFTETQVTWNDRNKMTNTAWTNAGGTFSSAISTIFVNKTVGYKSWGVTDTVKAWFAGSLPNNGFLVKKTPLTGMTKVKFISDDGAAAQRPILVIKYNTVSTMCSAILNRAPLAMLDVATTNSLTPVTIMVENNDIDPDGNPLSMLSIVGPVAGGTAMVSGNNIIFTPTTSFNGTATFLYKVCDNATLCDTARVNVTVTNAPPGAVNDMVMFNSSTVNNVIAVQANDTNPDGPTPLTTTIISGPNAGSASVSGLNILYTPIAKYFGPDTIIYTICEPVVMGSCDDPLCDTGYVFITVKNQPLIAINDTITTNQCLPVALSPLVNDSDPEMGPLTLTSVFGAVGGTPTINPNGTITFTPNNGFTGTASYQYVICDNGIPALCDTATDFVIIAVPPGMNRPPVALDDIAVPVNVDQVAFVPVLDNDSDPEGTPLTINLLGAPMLSPAGSGVISLQGQEVVFTPTPGFAGTVTFKYSVCDTAPAVAAGCTPLQIACDTAQVTVQIINQPPVAIDDTDSTTVNTMVMIDILSNDFDPDGLPLDSANIMTGKNAVLAMMGMSAKGGTITINASGVATYTPPLNYVGLDTFYYKVCDTFSLVKECDTALVCILIQAGPLSLMCPADTTLSCASALFPADANLLVVTNGCPPYQRAFIIDSIPAADSICVNKKIIYRKYRVSDACMDTLFCIQRITILDTTNPVITCPANVTIQCFC